MKKTILYIILLLFVIGISLAADTIIRDTISEFAGSITVTGDVNGTNIYQKTGATYYRVCDTSNNCDYLSTAEINTLLTDVNTTIQTNNDSVSTRFEALDFASYSYVDNGINNNVTYVLGLIDSYNTDINTTIQTNNDSISTRINALNYITLEQTNILLTDINTTIQTNNDSVSVRITALPPDTTCDDKTCDVTSTGTLDGYEATALLDNPDNLDNNSNTNISINHVQFQEHNATYYTIVWIE